MILKSFLQDSISRLISPYYAEHNRGYSSYLARFEAGGRLLAIESPLGSDFKVSALFFWLRVRTLWLVLVTNWASFLSSCANCSIVLALACGAPAALSKFCWVRSARGDFTLGVMLVTTPRPLGWQNHSCASTCASVKRFAGSTCSRLVMRSLALAATFLNPSENSKCVFFLARVSAHDCRCGNVHTSMLVSCVEANGEHHCASGTEEFCENLQRMHRSGLGKRR